MFVTVFATIDKGADTHRKDRVAARSARTAMAALAVHQIFFGSRAMNGTVFIGQQMRDVPGGMAIGVTLAEPRLIETVNFGNAPFKVTAMAFTA